MRLITGKVLLTALVVPGEARGVGHYDNRQLLSTTQKQQQQWQQRQLKENLWLHQDGGYLKIRGGAGCEGRALQKVLGTVRGGERSSDTAVLLETMADTVIESASIVGWVGITDFLAQRYVTGAYVEVARLTQWIVAVFLSGVATEGPRRWLTSSQLFNIEQSLSEDWYATIRKPSWNPPNWLFPIMWIPLKILQVFACYEMWGKLPRRSFTAAPVVVFAIYKSLGDVWNKVFFVRQRLGLATAVITVYFLTLLWGIKLFYDVSERAGYLFAPTALWVTVATCLQWSTWLLNRDRPHA